MQSPSGACACSAPSASEVTRAQRPGTQGRSRSRSAACGACRRPATAAGRVRILTSSRLCPACLRLAALCKPHSPRISAGAEGGDGSAARTAATDAAPAPGAAGTWGAPDAASARLQGGQGGHGAERGDPERRLRAEGARLGARSPATRRPPPPAASEPYAVWSRAAMRPAAPRQAAPRPRQGYASGARATRRARAAARARPGRGRCLPYWATYARPCLRGGRRRARAAGAWPGDEAGGAACQAAGAAAAPLPGSPPGPGHAEGGRQAGQGAGDAGLGGRAGRRRSQSRGRPARASAQGRPRPPRRPRGRRCAGRSRRARLLRRRCLQSAVCRRRRAAGAAPGGPSCGTASAGLERGGRRVCWQRGPGGGRGGRERGSFCTLPHPLASLHSLLLARVFAHAFCLCCSRVLGASSRSQAASNSLRALCSCRQQAHVCLLWVVGRWRAAVVSLAPQ